MMPAMFEQVSGAVHGAASKANSTISTATAGLAGIAPDIDLELFSDSTSEIMQSLVTKPVHISDIIEISQDPAEQSIVVTTVPDDEVSADTSDRLRDLMESLDGEWTFCNDSRKRNHREEREKNERLARATLDG